MDEMTRGVLLKAASLLEEQGWTQHQYQDNDGKRCLMGAIAAVDTTGRKMPYSVCDALRAHLKLTPKLSLSEWNDKPERTKEEVINALRGAATECGAGGQ